MKWKSLVIVVFAMWLQLLPCKAYSIDPEDTNSVIQLNLKGWQVRVNDLEQSRKYASEAIRIANKLNYTRGLSYSYNISGNYYKAKGLYDSSLFYYQKSLTI